MELTRYLNVVRQRLWMIIVCPIVAAIAAGIVSYVLPPVYEAHESVYVRPGVPIGSIDPNTGAAVGSDTILLTYAKWMVQPQILDEVNSQLGLGLRSDDLLKKIKVTPVPNTLLLDVAVQDTTPAVARDIAKQLVNDFIDTVKQAQAKATQAQAAQASTADNFVVTSDAVLPDAPVSPNKKLNVAIAFAAGLLLAIGLAFLLDYLDQSVKSDDELTERVGLIPIGHIAFQAAGAGKRGELVTLEEQSPAAEAYKALRTSLIYSTIDQELKEIVITSANPGEGKSRTAANLAVALASAGNRTLLVDADFRRPSQHRIFGRIRNVGLTNLIVQEVDEDEAVTKVDSVTNLWLLTSGPTPPNPSEMLGSTRMRELMDHLRPNFNYVIVDTPPVNAVSDALILAAFANGTVIVVEQGRTTYPALRQAKQMLDHVGARTVGAVMNKVRSSAGSYAYSYGYYASPSNGRVAANGSKSSEPEPTPTPTKEKSA
jgi:succinoglycan biosynthesis transport protein ExoP